MQLPVYIQAMEPMASKNVPKDDTYIHSVKWDGVRQFVYCENKEVRIHNRKLHIRTDTYPELHAIKKIIKGNNMVFDGEVVAIHEGKCSFQKVMKRDFAKSLETATRMIKSIPITYMVFDLLYYNGKSTMVYGLTKRLEMLREIIKETTDFIQVVDHVNDGEELFRATENLHLEGVVSKNRYSVYRQGKKHADWLKSKHFKDANVVVGGYTTKNHIINSLSIGIYYMDELRYMGNVATGLTIDELYTLTNELKNYTRQTSPFTNFTTSRKNQIWVEPKLTMKVSYLEITEEGRFRHPTIEGFLTVYPQECILE